MKQIIGVLSRLGVASVREWGVGSDGGVFTPSGNMTFKPIAMQIRQDLAAAKIGIVDLELSPEAWMGLDWGGTNDSPSPLAVIARACQMYARSAVFPRSRGL